MRVSVGFELRVTVSEEARSQLRAICGDRDSGDGGGGGGGGSGSARGAKAAGAPPPLRFFGGRPDEAEAAFVELLRADPRSVYRKQKCTDQVYRVCVDGIDAECTFDDERGEAALRSVRLLKADGSAVGGEFDGESGGADGATEDKAAEGGPPDARAGDA